MFLIAILGLAANASIDAEAPLLARDLGVSAYDARLLLAPGFPAIVRAAGEREVAVQLATALRARGHEVAAVDASAIASSASMQEVREFRLDEGALVSLHASGDASLPFDDIACILHAWHARRLDESGETTARKFDAVRAIASGGLMMTKKTTTSISAKSEAREDVLYLFRRSEEAPWIVRETRAKYGGLGKMAPSQRENFVELVKRLRASAHAATYDARLLAMKRIPETMTLNLANGTSTIAASSEAGMDALAHMLALLLSRRAISPYRG